MMQIHIYRSKSDSFETFEVPKGCSNLLEALYHIKENVDATLTFSAGCRSGVCGTCAVEVNGKPTLSCFYDPQENDHIKPLANHPVARDLKVDKHASLATLEKAQAHLNRYRQSTLSPKDEARIQTQSDCILCDCCYTACPVFSVNDAFLGPFSLSRAYRYVSDPRENNTASIIDAVVQNGIWDCTLCNECTLACPKGIDPKNDILQLRTQAIRHGHNDPTFAQNFGTPDFGGGFGFNDAN